MLTTPCHIYKSGRKADLYLFVRTKDDFSAVPGPLLTDFGEPQYVMELELYPGRRLARGDATEVIGRLKEAGYHLQLPPADPWA